MLRHLLLLGLLAGLHTVWAASALIYPRHQARNDPQLQYMLEVLRLAVSKSGKSYELRQRAREMVQSRAIAELASNSGAVDVIWVMSTPEREAQLIPVRIPVDRGLIGWRLALVNAQRADVLRGVKDSGALARFTSGQMHDWPDTDILRANGLPVLVSPTYEGLFQQLATNRIDYFPRSVMEIRNELQSHDGLPLAMDESIMIRYPAAFYFFVSKKRPELAAYISKGLEAALADGSFHRLFRQHMWPVLEGLKLQTRTVIQLKNPSLPDATPLARRELWFELDELRAKPRTP
ncbi:MAG: transporter substrate-binding domain-containing protein [Aquabacterium sp.]|nr:transporter substrate-binding domain-containing protein [Aquabacterium sp.]